MRRKFLLATIVSGVDTDLHIIVSLMEDLVRVELIKRLLRQVVDVKKLKLVPESVQVATRALSPGPPLRLQRGNLL